MSRLSTSTIVAGLTLGGLLLIGSTAGAQPVFNPYNVDQREDYQQDRIQRGIESGALTPGEARHLEKEQGRIQAAEDRMRADGRLSPWERQRLNQMQNQANRDIQRLEHNGRTAEGWDNGSHNGWGGHYNSGWSGGHPGGWGGYAADPRFDRREDRQRYRSQQGAHSGALTPGEARHLEREQGRIQGVEDRLRADGRLSPWERQRLNQMQNRAGRDSYRQEHNGRTWENGGSQPGWQGNNQGWGGRGHEQGTSSGGYGTTPSGAPVTGINTGGTAAPGTTRGWWGNRSGGSSTTPSGATTATNPQNWRGGHQGWNGSSAGATVPSGTATPAAATTGATATPGNTQGWRGNYAHQGQPGTFRPPNFQGGNSGHPPNWQGQPRFQQQAPPQMTQPMMRPQPNMMARPPANLGGVVNRGGAPGGTALRRR